MSTPPTRLASPDRLDPAVLRVAVVVVLGSIMSVLDTTIVNVALETLSRDLHSTIDDIQWVVTGYLLSLAAVIPVTGWAARRYGARRIYLASIALFTVASALCGLAWSTGSLVFFRVLQGVGGGTILPVGQMILARAAGPQRMGRVMSLIGVPVVMAPILGPTIGGLLLEHLGWRWIFFVNLPIGVVAVIVGLRLLPPDRGGRADAGPLDAFGLATLAAGLVGITYGLAEVGVAGTVASARVALPLVGGLALTAAFVVRALRVSRPVLDVRLYRNRAFSAASITTFCLGGALFGASILMPLWFQVVRGESAVVTGLLLAPQGMGVALAMFWSGRLTDRVGGGPLALAGVLLTAAATVPFAFFTDTTPLAAVCGWMALRGVGIGLAFMPAMAAAFAAMTREQIPDATPQLNVLQRVGGSIGTAILAVVLQDRLSALGPSAGAGARAEAFGQTYWWAIAITLAAAVPAIVLIFAERSARRRRRAEEAAAAARAREAETVPA